MDASRLFDFFTAPYYHPTLFIRIIIIRKKRISQTLHFADFLNKYVENRIKIPFLTKKQRILTLNEHYTNLFSHFQRNLYMYLDKNLPH